MGRPYLPVVEVELTFVAGCQTEVLCLMPSKKRRSVTKYQVLSSVDFWAFMVVGLSYIQMLFLLQPMMAAR